MSYPIAGGPTPGDIVTIEAKVTSVEGGNVVFALPLADDELEYLRPIDGLTIGMRLESFYLSVKAAERPAPRPVVGDIVVALRNRGPRGRVLAVNGGQMWVEWSDGSHGLHEIAKLIDGRCYRLEPAGHVAGRAA